MASKLHLHLLKEGLPAWELWRQQNPKKQPNLREADLYAASLRGANLRLVRLSGADLSSADLSQADLSSADLCQANLSNAQLLEARLCDANLSRARLGGAQLNNAQLSGACLNSAFLTGANLSGADLRNADLTEAALSGADLTEADLTGAKLYEAKLQGTKLNGAKLAGAKLNGADLADANLSGADLSGAQLCGANLQGAHLNGANLSRANLMNAQLMMTNLEQANLSGCLIRGVCFREVRLEGANQSNLILTSPKEPAVVADDFAVANFLALLLQHQRIRDVITAITTKFVLILGHFTPEREALLETIRQALRQRGYWPILFDGEQATSPDAAEMLSSLGHLARFIIADLTEARSLQQQLLRLLRQLPAVPVQPLLQMTSSEEGLGDCLKSLPYVLQTHYYASPEEAVAVISAHVVAPAEAMIRQLEDEPAALEKESPPGGGSSGAGQATIIDPQSVRAL